MAIQTTAQPPHPPVMNGIGPELTAMQLVRQPFRSRRLARIVFWLFLATPFALIFIPWQQSVSAEGKVIAFDPTERRQILDAPVSGRVVKWHVLEGDTVKGPVYRKEKVLKPEDAVVVGDVKDVQPGDLIKVLVQDDEDQTIVEERIVRSGDYLVEEEREVSPGDVLVSIRDPNPMFLSDLAQERRAIEERMGQARQRSASLGKQVEALRSAAKQAIEGAEKRLQASRDRLRGATEAVKAAEAAFLAADQAFAIQDNLFKEKLAARIDVIEAQRRKDSADADRERVRAARSEAEANVLAAEADLARVRSDTEAGIQGVTAQVQQAEGEVFQTRRDLVQIRVRQRRQGTQDVTAPCDGTILQVLANGGYGGGFVKEGDPLLVFIPTIPDDKPRRQVVELFLDGNDAPLVTALWREKVAQGEEQPRIPVRIQFEGWPAVQFVGWPSVAVGTYGGQVVFIDAHADAKGQFRILVEPDPEEEPWPQDFSLRQGIRANGWVLLNRVPLWWEMWRRLNGFPPVIAPDEPDDDGKGKAKPPKLPKG